MGTRGRGDQTWDLGEEAQEREAGGPEGGNGIWDPEHLQHGLGQAAEASRAAGPGEGGGRISQGTPLCPLLPLPLPWLSGKGAPTKLKAQCLLPQLWRGFLPLSLKGGGYPACCCSPWLSLDPPPPAAMLRYLKSVWWHGNLFLGVAP